MTKLLPEKYKADVNHILIKYQATPLFNAAVQGHVEVVRYLLESHNTDIHLGNSGYANGSTALHNASLNVAVNNPIANRLEDVVGILLKHGGRSHWCRR
jgi:plasmid replication initiation protein